MPLVIDICCGLGGWTNGFISKGWDARGYDIRKQPTYPATMVECDLLELVPFDLADADFVVCSTPCEQFSVYGMKHFHPNPPPPVLGMKLFEHARSICLASGKPFIMENVRCAERFVGRAVNHCGPFYLWGNAVPAIFPPECYRVVKDLHMGSGGEFRRMSREALRELRRTSSAKHAARTAQIPFVVASYIAEVAEQWIHQRA